MELVYLGFFSRVVDWVLGHIFEPVYRFVSNLLNVVLTWVFQDILAPILMPVLQGALEFAIKLWVQIYSTQLYLCFSGVLKLIDYLETAFDVFIGLRDVTYQPGAGEIKGSLVEILIQQDMISQVFWVITLGGLGIAMMLTIFATAKSAFDLDFENKRPVTKVLAAMMKTFVQFFTVPFLVFFVLKLSIIILRGITVALSPEGTTTLGRMVFVIASLNAAIRGEYNASSANAVADIGPMDELRMPFYLAESDTVTVKDYGRLADVADSFFLGKFDYLIGFITAVFLLFTIGICLIIFIQRIFEIMILYLVSPYFVCTMPLDDGEKFRRWREMFVGKCFSGFGSAIGMRLFLLICPLIMGNQIRFTAGSSTEMEYMMKLFFIAGGAWAVYKSGPMITSLISSQAGQSEMQTANMIGGMLYGATLGTAVGKGRSALSSMGRRMGSGLGRKGSAGGLAGKGAKGKGADSSQAFQGDKKKPEKWKWKDIKVDALNADRQKEKDKIIAARAKQRAAAAGVGGLAGAGTSGLSGKGGLSGAVASGLSEKGGLSGAVASGLSEKGGLSEEASKFSEKGNLADGTFGLSGKEGPAETDKLKLPGEDGLKIPEAGGLNQEEKEQDPTFTDKPLETGGKTDSGEEADAAEAEGEGTDEKPNQVKGHNIHLGSFITRQYNEDGSMKFRVMGFGYGRDAEGKTNSVRFPGLKMNKMKDGHYMVGKFSALPGVKIARTETKQGIKYSHIGLLGYQYHRSEEGKEYRLGKGIVIQKGADGSRRYQVGNRVKTKDFSGDIQYSFGKTTIQKDADGSRQYQRGGASYTKVMGEKGAMEKHYSGPVTLHLKTPAGGTKSRLESIQIGNMNYDRSGKIHDFRIGKKPEDQEGNK